MLGTGPLNKAIDTLATGLANITGVPIVRDPRNITPGCVLIGPPSGEAFNNNNILRVEIPLIAISSGPGNQDALVQLLSIVGLILAKNIGVTDYRPTTVNMGGVDAPAYEMTVRMQAQAE